MAAKSTSLGSPRVHATRRTPHVRAVNPNEIISDNDSNSLKFRFAARLFFCCALFFFSGEWIDRTRQQIIASAVDNDYDTPVGRRMYPLILTAPCVEAHAATQAMRRELAVGRASVLIPFAPPPRVPRAREHSNMAWKRTVAKHREACKTNLTATRTVERLLLF